MLPALIPISSLLLSSALLLLGHGLLLTLLPIYGNTLGFSNAEVAFTGSAYFLGFVSGCIVTPHILKRVGHIRSFAVLATSYSVVILIFPWLPEFTGWLLLRFLVGVAISGLYMIIESWLSERSDASNRGSILSIYTVLNMIMMMAGQQLLNFGNVDSHMLFGLAAISVSVAIIPVSLTLALAPAPVSNVKLNFTKVWARSHVALISAVSAGLVTGAFWSLAPIYAKENDFDNTQLTIFMSATVLGGACFQFPLGRMSDRYDRRVILMFMALAGSLACLAFVFLPALTPNFGGWLASLIAFLWGGACMTIYAISLAHANDNAPATDFVEIGTAMLVTLGVCSAIGAPMASAVMNFFGAEGLYIFSSLCLFLFFVMVLVRRHQHYIPEPLTPRDSFQTISTMSAPTVFEIDPRNESHTTENTESGEK